MPRVPRVPKEEMDKILATLRRHLTPKQQEEIEELQAQAGK